MRSRPPKSYAQSDTRKDPTAEASDAFEEQLEETAAILEKELRTRPNELQALWTARFYGELLTDANPRLRDAAKRFEAMRAGLDEALYLERMEEVGATAHLVALWNGLHESRFGARALPLIATWIIDLCRDEKLLDDLGDSADGYREPELAERFRAAARRLTPGTADGAKRRAASEARRDGESTFEPCKDRKAPARDSFERRLDQTADQLEQTLSASKSGPGIYTMWCAKFYGALISGLGPRVTKAAKRFDACRPSRKALEDEGVVEHLIDLWKDARKSRYGERARPVIAAWLVDLARDEEKLERLGESARSCGDSELAERFCEAARRLTPKTQWETKADAPERPRIDERLLERLNKAHEGGIRFSLADRSVATGRRKLVPAEQATVYHGKRGKWGTWCESFGAPYQPKPGELDTRVKIRLGEVQKLRRGELRCYQAGGPKWGEFAVPEVRVGYFREGKLASMELTYTPTRKLRDDASFDEGWFTLFGPKVFVGTPFSDNDPDQCELMTVDQLRDLGK